MVPRLVAQRVRPARLEIVTIRRRGVMLRPSAHPAGVLASERAHPERVTERIPSDIDNVRQRRTSAHNRVPTTRNPGHAVVKRTVRTFPDHDTIQPTRVQEPGKARARACRSAPSSSVRHNGASVCCWPARWLGLAAAAAVIGPSPSTCSRTPRARHLQRKPHQGGRPDQPAEHRVGARRRLPGVLHAGRLHGPGGRVRPIQGVGEHHDGVHLRHVPVRGPVLGDRLRLRVRHRQRHHRALVLLPAPQHG